jgi:tetratricopeptide (TPR) repeat protein
LAKLTNNKGIFFLLLILLLPGTATYAQEPDTSMPPELAEGTSRTEDRGLAYYHYSLGHHYEELAGLWRRGEYMQQAIDEFKKALEYAPDSSEIVVRLANAYRRSGRIRDAVEEAQGILKKNPDDLATHRLLGRIYFQTLGGSAEQARGRATLGLAIEEYEHIVRLSSEDTDALLTLAQLYRFNNQLEKAETTLDSLLAVAPGSEAGMGELALIYSFRGEHQRAVDLLQGSAVETTSSQLLSRLGYAYEQSEDFTSAIQSYRRALQLEEDLQTRSRLAEVLFRTNEFAAALEEYQALLTIDPNNAQVLLRMAQAYRIQKNYPEADKALEKARELQPANLDVAFNSALLRQAQGDFNGAEEVLKELLTKLTHEDGRYSDEAANSRSIVLERLGILQRENEKFKGAVATFLEMKELGDPHVNRAWVQIIETHRQSRNLEAAVAAAGFALERFPDDVNLKMQFANVLGERGEVERAVELARAQEGLGIDSRQVQLAVAQIYERNRRYEEALAVLAEAEAAARSDADLEFVFFLRGAVYERQDDILKAEAEFRRVLEINPESDITLNYLGYMLADKNLKLDEALEMIQKAVDSDPYNSAYLDSLGWVYFRLKKMDLAEKYLLQATDRSSNDPTLYDHLGDVYYETGRLALAEQAWERATAIWKSLPSTDFDKEEHALLEDKLQRLKVRLARQTTSKTAAPPR